MACLFGHKWGVYKCQKCGKIKDDDPASRKEMIKQLPGHDAVLLEIAKNDTDASVRIAALERMFRYHGMLNPVKNLLPLLSDIARNDNEPFIRIMAIEKIHDRETLQYVVDNDDDSSVREHAMKRLDVVKLMPSGDPLLALRESISLANGGNGFTSK